MAPPKPRLVLRLGVSGHRPNQFPEEAQKLVRQKLDVLFGQFRQALDALHRREAPFFDGEVPQVHVISALAEGTDRIAAEAGVAAGFTLDAVLPFDADLYENDFETAESKTEYRRLLGQARARMILPGERSATDANLANRAYEAVGLMALRQCDVLVTVWNGAEAAGRGGTASMIQHAVSIGRPVLRFDENGGGPFLLTGDRLGPVDARDLVARTRELPADEAAVGRIVEHLCAPPGPAAQDDDHQKRTAEEARARLTRFFAEKERRSLILAFAYPLLLSFFTDKKGFWRSLRSPAYLPRTEEEWATYWSELAPAGPRICEPLRRIIMDRFAWTDKLANYYGQRHRSGYISNYVFATLAVLCAVAAGAAEVHGPAFPAWAGQCLELIAIFIIVVSTWRGTSMCWHARWLDYRQLSAQLRNLRALALTGSSTWEARSPHLGEELRAGTLWVNWYYRTTMREIGVIDAQIDERYLATARAAIGKGEIKDQADYHETNARRMHAIANRLEKIGPGLFLVTPIVCLAEVAVGLAQHGAWVDWNSSLLLETLYSLSVLLPAAGAAVFGIRVQGDFEGSAERSERMTRSLKKIADRLASPEKLSFAELSGLTENAAAVMAGELGDWGFVYSGRPLGLPT